MIVHTELGKVINLLYANPLPTDKHFKKTVGSKSQYKTAAKNFC